VKCGAYFTGAELFTRGASKVTLLAPVSGSKKGVEFLHRPCFAFEAEDAKLWFLYIKDPDGIPGEAVAAVPKK